MQDVRLGTRDYLDSWKPKKPTEKPKEEERDQEPPLAEELGMMSLLAPVCSLTSNAIQCSTSFLRAEFLAEFDNLPCSWHAA